MTILVLGATGMTGRCVVTQLLSNGHKVRIIVRSTDNISTDILNSSEIEIIRAAVLDLSDQQIATQVAGCTSIVSCLGHNMDFRGLFGHPRQLCTQTVRRMCAVLQRNAVQPVKFIMISSVGVTSPEDNNQRSWFDRALLLLLRHTLPPHRDNETAAQFLSDNISASNSKIQWCCVRPDSLINAEISPVEVTHNPLTAITSGRPTTRGNVAKFMVELIENREKWDKWQFKMPVIMNAN